MPKCAALQTSTGNMEVFFKSHFKISKQSQKPTIDFNYLITTKTTKKTFFQDIFFFFRFHQYANTKSETLSQVVTRDTFKTYLMAAINSSVSDDHL